MLYTVLIVFHVVLAASLIALVLVQRGPGATMGAAFGAGASGTVFGSRGSASFLTRLTSWMGVGFFAISLSMAVIAARTGGVAEAPDDLGVVGQIQPLPPTEQVEEGEAFQPLLEVADEDEDDDADIMLEPPPD
ncbi:MAG: preprotein translocase subunit SecG [Wenzhouxiangella sp.]|nr:MAG: preprotein translocase subunit SecG [Wenzhouxiangella sp.]